MTTADYNQAIEDALRVLSLLLPPEGEPALESLRNISIGERSVLAQAEVRIRDLLKPEPTLDTGE